MFLAEIDRLLRRHNPLWRRAIAVAFAIAACQSIAIVLRPIPIKSLIEPRMERITRSLMRLIVNSVEIIEQNTTSSSATIIPA